ncbi:hypothetical protein [Pandoraea sputorum]|uniref:Uncharacterized protein n=1 Tax=Pandoraea sputorum TaxID=93222 RepID=A0A5E5BBY2_9BURK|nr:hypothetical protein [Pandoraea sputorum]VVE82876.1 hypothetical protein PSP31121_04012 [Pandoraea sputorum]
MGKQWSYAEDVILEEVYERPEPLSSQLHLLPGRNESSCKNRARALGLTKVRRSYAKVRGLVIDALQLRQMTAPQIAKHTGAHINPVREELALMVNAGLVHVAKWVPAPKNNVPIRCYALGEGRNAPAPLRKTQKERGKAWLERQDKEEYRVRRAGYRIREKMKAGKLIPPRHELMTALFGSV